MSQPARSFAKKTLVPSPLGCYYPLLFHQLNLLSQSRLEAPKTTHSTATARRMSAAPSATGRLGDRRIVFALVAAAAVAWILLPPAPNYDTATHLVWARELLHGHSPDVSAAAAPTPHPLWILISVLAVAVASSSATSVMTLISIASLAVVVGGIFALGRVIWTARAGVLGALAVASSFALLLLAFKAYADLLFLAFAIWAAVLEARRYVPTGVVDVPPVLAAPILAALAGLLRPEAWAFGLLLVAGRWFAARHPSTRLVTADAGPTRGAPSRPVVAAEIEVPFGVVARAEPSLWLVFGIVIAAPLLWALSDLLLTGDPMHSLTGTQKLAEALGRPTGLLKAPVELLRQLSDLARPPVALAGVIGAALAVRVAGVRRLAVPLGVLIAGCVGFLLVGALGLPLLARYLLLPALMLCLLAGVLLDLLLHRAGVRFGATAEPGDPRRFALPRPVAITLLGLTLLVGVAYLVLKASSFSLLARGVLRQAAWQRDAAALVRDPRVQAGAHCGPITLPTYRLVPELTFALDVRPKTIQSRATALGGIGPQQSGVAIVVDPANHGALTTFGQAAGVPFSTNAVPPGFTVIARRGPFAAAVRCPAPG